MEVHLADRVVAPGAMLSAGDEIAQQDRSLGDDRLLCNAAECLVQRFANPGLGAKFGPRRIFKWPA